MLTYNVLKEKAKEFLAATVLKIEEFAQPLPAFESAYHALYPADQTAEGKTRQRQPGGGTKGTLRTVEDKLLFILVYQKTYPLQALHGLQFGLSQPQTHYWIHRLLPVLQRALADLKMTREGEEVAAGEWVNEHAPDLLIDGSERRRQCPKEVTQPRAHYSGKKRAHTDKNIILVNEHTGKVVYLSPMGRARPTTRKWQMRPKSLFPRAQP
jgi:hypothetical protein